MDHSRDESEGEASCNEWAEDKQISPTADWFLHHGCVRYVRHRRCMRRNGRIRRRGLGFWPPGQNSVNKDHCPSYVRSRSLLVCMRRTVPSGALDRWTGGPTIVTEPVLWIIASTSSITPHGNKQIKKIFFESKYVTKYLVDIMSN